MNTLTTFLKKKFLAPQPTYQLSIVAIAKNEINYLLEWIAYHKLIGVEHFYIADNSSTDGTRELLAKLQQVGIVTFIDWPIKKKAQCQWYNHVRKKYFHETKYMIFIDLDEFLMSKKIHEIKKTILSLLEKEDTGAIAINWRIMGSAGIKHENSELVLKKFNMSSKKDRIVNKHFKSIIKPAAVKSMTAHAALLKKDYKYLLSNGSETQFINNTPTSGRTVTVTDTPITVHHYVVKSLEEFIKFKQNRGSAIRGEAAVKDINYFNNHDINDEEFKLPTDLLSQLEIVINKLNLDIALTS